MTRLAALLGLRNLAERYGYNFQDIPEYSRIHLGNLLIDSGLRLKDCTPEKLDQQIAALGYQDDRLGEQ